MSYKAKYLKARERFHEFVARNDLLKGELTSVFTDVQELRDEIKVLINTIIGTAPEYEPSFTSDEAFEEGLELQGHHEGDEANAINEEHDDYETTPRSSRAAPNTHSPHFRQPRQSAAVSYSPSQRPLRNSTNGRHAYQSSRRQYEEPVDDGFVQDGINPRDYVDNSAISPYNDSIDGDIQENHYYAEENNNRSTSSRHRSSHRGGESQFHPYPQASRSSESRSRNGNGHRSSNPAAAVAENGSPDSRYSNYSHRSYRN